MGRTREIIDRKTWIAMLGHLDSDAQDVLLDELAQWNNGNVCNKIAVSLDSLGRLDSQSSPRPAD